MDPKSYVYLDNSATTQLDPEVLEAMIPYFTDKFGNAASRNHSFGWDAEDGVTEAREKLAAVLGAKSSEIIFTSGATESNNLALKGAAEMLKEKGKHIITCSLEHKAILDPCARLEEDGFELTYIKPHHQTGRVEKEDILKSIRPDTILISIMMANNEIGTIQPIAEIGKIAREAGIWFHTDATQAVGKIPIDVNALNVDLLSLSAHKFYGPKGIGALFVRRRNPRVRLRAQMDGGQHERGMRSGTLNVPSIVGIGKAAECSAKKMQEDMRRIEKLRDRLERTIFEKLEHCAINGDVKNRIATISNISFAFVEGEGLMMGMKGIAVSSGSACTSATLEPSYVLKEIGVGDDLAHSSIRFSLGRFTTEEDIDRAIEKTVHAVNRLRELSPLYEMHKQGIDPSKVQWTRPQETHEVVEAASPILG